MILCCPDTGLTWYCADIVQYSAIQYSAIQYSTVQHSTVQYSTVQYSTVQYSTVQYSTVQVSIQMSSKNNCYSFKHHRCAKSVLKSKLDCVQCILQYTTIHSTKHTSHYTQHTAHNTQQTTHNTQYTTHSTQHTAHNTQHTTHSTQHTTHNTQHTHISHNIHHTTHITQHTSHNTEHTPQRTECNGAMGNDIFLSKLSKQCNLSPHHPPSPCLLHATVEEQFPMGLVYLTRPILRCLVRNVL